jgi:hypothetical protein
MRLYCIDVNQTIKWDKFLVFLAGTYTISYTIWGTYEEYGLV